MIARLAENVGALGAEMDILIRRQFRKRWKAQGLVPGDPASPLPMTMCIFKALALRDALQQCGFDAIAAPCDLHVFNDTACTPGNDDGYLLEVVHDSEGDQSLGWNGHLVTLVEGYLFDLDLGRYSRPERRIQLGRGYLAGPFWQPDVGPWYSQAIGSCQVRWRSRPENTFYKTTANARQQLRARLVRKLSAWISANGYSAPFPASQRIGG